MESEWPFAVDCTCSALDQASYLVFGEQQGQTRSLCITLHQKVGVPGVPYPSMVDIMDTSKYIE